MSAFLIFRLPFGTELNTGLAIFMRCKIEEMMTKRSGGANAIEKELYLVDVSDAKPIVSDDTAEFEKVYALWEAVGVRLLCN
jgi:hypothetical protein